MPDRVHRTQRPREGIGVRSRDRDPRHRPTGHQRHEVARALRARAGGRALYIAAVTGWGQPQDRVKAIEGHDSGRLAAWPCAGVTLCPGDIPELATLPTLEHSDPTYSRVGIPHYLINAESEHPDRIPRPC